MALSALSIRSALVPDIKFVDDDEPVRAPHRMEPILVEAPPMSEQMRTLLMTRTTDGAGVQRSG